MKFLCYSLVSPREPLYHHHFPFLLKCLSTYQPHEYQLHVCYALVNFSPQVTRNTALKCVLWTMLCSPAKLSHPRLNVMAEDSVGHFSVGVEHGFEFLHPVKKRKVKSHDCHPFIL